MFTKDCLPLLDLTRKQTPTTIVRLQHALLKYGAFRLSAPELKRALAGGILPDVSLFF